MLSCFRSRTYGCMHLLCSVECYAALRSLEFTYIDICKERT